MWQMTIMSTIEMYNTMSVYIKVEAYKLAQASLHCSQSSSQTTRVEFSLMTAFSNNMYVNFQALQGVHGCDFEF